MWLVEKAPSGNDFWPININLVKYISSYDYSSTHTGEHKHAIKFHFGEEDVVRWNFKDKSDRDKYLEPIRKVLPQLSLGVDEISL